MSKKIKIDLGNLFLCFAVIFGLLAFFMIFTAAVKGTGKIIGTEPIYSGTQVVFGYKEGDTTVLTFNFTAFLGLFFLPISAVAFTILSFLQSKKLFSAIAATCFLIGGVIAFFTVASFKAGVASGTYFDLYEWKIGVGAVLSGVFSIIACLNVAVKEIFNL